MAWAKAATPNTLGSAGDSISIIDVDDLKYYMVLTHIIPSGNFRETYRVNNDTGSNYAQRDSSDGAADALKTSQARSEFGKKDEATNAFSVSYWFNISTEEKLWINWEVRANTAGAGNAVSRNEHVGKWSNTSDPVDRIDILNDQSGNFAIGSNCSILGAT
jgi:hypothetical protein